MWQHRARFVTAATAVMALALTSCGIAETKLPPDPTVEYLPCAGMGLEGLGRVDPLVVLLDISPTLEESWWGGMWTVGQEWHIGLTDVGAIDWQVACPGIGDPDLVVHEAPFVIGDLEMWSARVGRRIPASTAGQRLSVDLVVVAGQYVAEVRADTVEEAGALTEGIPLDAWVYGGPVSSGSG